MAVKMNLWSLTLLPGETYPMYVRRDFVLTNAALGEELASETSRSVVKVTHHPISPSQFDSDSEDEFDSDMEDELNDEFDEAELEQAEAEAKAELESKPKAKKGGKAAKAEKIEVDEEEDDEDEDDDEDDSEFDEEEVEETTVLCALTAGKIEQASLNLTFVEGEVVMFEVSGDNAVHLLGNYINQFPDESDSDSDYDSEEDDFSDIYGSDEELDSEEEATVAKITEIKESEPKSKKAVAAASTPAAKPAVKRKADDLDSPAGKTAPAAAETGELSKTQKKKLAKKQKTEEAAAPAAAAPAKAEKKEVKKENKPAQKRTLPSGLVIEDMKVGDGPAAKAGKRLGMRYIGKLENGKQFDANTSGKPFTFVLGKGEVISGWDQGLAGMAVGGERRLTIPPQMAYGSQKIPGIPKNSTLKFDVKLVSIN